METVLCGRWPKRLNGPAEPISWLRFDQGDGLALLVSENVVEAWPYHERKEPTSWAECDLRFWLNACFLEHAFSEQERACIVESELERDANDDYPSSVNEPTRDHVFCLSATQARELFPQPGDSCAVPTDYAFARDAGTWWWLRTMGLGPRYAMCVSSNGSLSRCGDSVDEVFGVRPAMAVRIDDVLDLERAAVGGFSPVLAGEGLASTCEGQSAPGQEAASATLGEIRGTWGQRFDASWGKTLGSRTAWALRYGQTERAGELLASGCALETVRAALYALKGAYGAECAFARAGAIDEKSASSLLSCVGAMPQAACMVARSVDLDVFPLKAQLVCALAKQGSVEELRLVAGHAGYFTQEVLQDALAQANDAGAMEAVAFLLEQQSAQAAQTLQDASTLGFSGGLDLEL